MGTFNNREIATAIWLFLFFALGVRNAGTRQAVTNLIRTFCDGHILSSVAAMLVYTVGIVFGLRVLGVWTAELLKDTILWFCFTAFVLMVTVVTDESERILRKVARETVKMLLFFEFLINEYTFSLAVELILVPAITMIAIMDVLARRDKKFSPVAKLAGVVLALFGLFLVANAVGRAVEGFDQLATGGTFRKVVLAPTLTLLYVPFLYLAILYSSYNRLFVHLKIGPAKSDNEITAIKRRLMLHFGFNTAALRRFSNAHAWDLTRVCTEIELTHLLAEWRAGNSAQFRELHWNDV